MIPALHLRNVREIVAFVNWAFDNKVQYATMSYGSTLQQVATRLVDNSEANGISVYIEGRMFWSTMPETAASHPAMTLVNSLNHLKAYLARKEGR